jgi:hypothetical protein
MTEKYVPVALADALLLSSGWSGYPPLWLALKVGEAACKVHALVKDRHRSSEFIEFLPRLSPRRETWSFQCMLVSRWW